MSKEMLKNLIELVPEEDVEVLYKVIIRLRSWRKRWKSWTSGSRRLPETL